MDFNRYFASTVLNILVEDRLLFIPKESIIIGTLLFVIQYEVHFKLFMKKVVAVILFGNETSRIVLKLSLYHMISTPSHLR